MTALTKRLRVAVTVVCAFASSTSFAKPTACDLMSAQEVAQALGKPAEIQDARPGYCWWTTPYRMLSISIDDALFDEAKQMRMAREAAQKMSPKHAFQDEPSIAPHAFSEALKDEVLIRFMKGKKAATVKLDKAPEGTEAARRVAKLVYSRM